MLVEVMVGAVVLAIAATAILSGIDGAQSAGGRNKAKSIQASLAQQDIERMRGLPLATLDGLNQTTPVNVGGVDYTIVSTTSWISDASGAVSCSDSRAQAEYLKLTSSVTSPATGTTPVTETGLLTPPATAANGTTGNATVQLTDRNGNPLANVGVSLSGASSRSATTNSLGCAVFGATTVGTYTISVTNYVTQESNGTATGTMQVYPGRGTLAPMQVDRPASVKATFVKQTSLGTPTVAWNSITVVNANLTGGSKPFTGSSATTQTATGLYPFLDGVDVYAGTCDKNDPSSYAGQSNYFTTSGKGHATLAPNQNSPPAAVNVEMPNLRVIVKRSSAFQRARVTVTPADGCGSAAVYNVQDNLSPTNATHNHDMVLPFGIYRICADDSSRYIVNASVDLTAAPSAANKSITLTVPTSGTGNSGTCPK